MENKKELVSICIPAYNAAQTIAITLESLVTQSYKNFEIHVVNNASTDNTSNIVIEFIQQYKNIVLHNNIYTVNAEKNFTKCLFTGSGKYRAIYHADDVYNKNILQEEVNFLESNLDIGAVLTRADFINENNEIIKRSKSFSHYGTLQNNALVYSALPMLQKILQYSNFCICPSLMMRSIYCESLTKWDREKFATAADVDFFLRIAEKYKLGFINKSLVNYRLSHTHYSYNYNLLRTEISDIFKVYNVWMNKNEIKQSLTKKDYGWHDEWLRRDSLRCAGNAILKNDINLAKQILKNRFSMKFFYYSVNSLRGLRYFMLFMLVIGGCYLYPQNLFKILLRKVL